MEELTFRDTTGTLVHQSIQYLHPMKNLKFYLVIAVVITACLYAIGLAPAQVQHDVNQSLGQPPPPRVSASSTPVFSSPPYVQSFVDVLREAGHTPRVENSTVTLILSARPDINPLSLCTESNMENFLRRGGAFVVHAPDYFQRMEASDCNQRWSVKHNADIISEALRLP